LLALFFRLLPSSEEPPDGGGGGGMSRSEGDQALALAVCEQLLDPSLAKHQGPEVRGFLRQSLDGIAR
jgi:hypothetical protein